MKKKSVIFIYVNPYLSPHNKLQKSDLSPEPAHHHHSPKSHTHTHTHASSTNNERSPESVHANAFPLMNR